MAQDTQAPTCHRPTSWLAALLLCTAAWPAAAEPAAYRIADAQAVAAALREASRGLLGAQADNIELKLACGGRPGTKIPDLNPADRRLVLAGAAALGIRPDKYDPLSKGCVPSDLRLLQATTQTLAAMGALKAHHPAIAGSLVIKPGPGDEAARLARGLGIVLATLGTEAPGMPKK